MKGRGSLQGHGDGNAGRTSAFEKKDESGQKKEPTKMSFDHPEKSHTKSYGVHFLFVKF
jgi:hypothetical protein